MICTDKEAETIKYASNCFLYLKVIYANILFNLATAEGSDYEKIKAGMAADPRIGDSHLGISSDGGRGAGGNCFIKDFAAFREYIEKIDDNNLDTIGKITIGQELMLSGAEKINISTPVYISKPQNTETISPTPPSETVENPSPSQLEPSAPSNTKLLWPTVGHTITQYYSWRHTGVDIANHIGTPLYAAADGVVEFAGWNSGGYGNMLFINCGGGTKLRYGHSSKLLVSVGDHVKRGQVIALMGSTGHSTGPHVHFEVYINNIRTNPLNYIR